MKQRIITGVLGAIVFLTMVVLGGLPFTIFILLLASIAMIELLKMKKIPPLSFIGLISLILMWLLLVPSNWLELPFLSHVSKVEIFVFMTLILLMVTVISKNRFTFDEVGFIILSSVYVGFGFHYLIVTRLLPDQGLVLLFFILIIIWATDSGAYFVGRSLGKRKLWPEISPNKTIEGSVGGIISALVVGIAFQLIIPVFATYLTLILVIILASVFGQVGDLVESALKRHYAVKDSGNVLPGHGGILDRFDSLIYVLPILHLLQLL